MKNGDFMVDEWDFMVDEWNFMDFYGGLMGSNGILPSGELT